MTSASSTIAIHNINGCEVKYSINQREAYSEGKKLMSIKYEKHYEQYL
jgi:hypothetical protein